MAYPNALPFRDFRTFVECLEKARCRIISHTAGASYLQILAAKESPLGRRILATFRDRPILITPTSEITDAILREERVYLVWIASRLVFDQSVGGNRDCEFYVVSAPLQEAWTFPVRKGSPLRSLLNRMSIPFRENGLGYVLQRRHSMPDMCDQKSATTRQWNAQSTDAETFYVYGVGMAISVAVFGIELLAHRRSCLRRQWQRSRN